MSEEKDIREDLKKSYGYYAHTGGKEGVSLVPVFFDRKVGRNEKYL